MGWYHMVASRPREPRPASPDPYEPNQTWEWSRRRANRRPHATASRQPRSNLDSLAIGAPLTAALIGALLVEGDGALGQSAGVAAEAGGAARRGDDEAGSATEQGTTLARFAPAREGGAAGNAAASTGGQIFDPVLGEDAPVLAGAPSGTVAGTLSLPDVASAAVDAKAALSAGMNITVSGGAPVGASGLGNGSPGPNPAPSNGRIGDTINGTDGDDVIHGTPYDDRLFGGAGDDTIYGYAGDDLLDGGAGHDKLYGGAGDDQLLGGSGNDRLYGGTGDDLLLGGTGNDRVFGNEGWDRLDGGSGNDLLDGGPDADRMTGGGGADVLVVDHLHDVALENARGPDRGGDDLLQIGDGFADHLPAGVDSVTFVFSSKLGAALPGEAASYRQQVGLEIEHVTLAGDADHDVNRRCRRILGNSGDNALFGRGGDDLLKGGAGSDHLEGGAGRDRLDGGDGDDILEGGRGADLLYGQDGDDTYLIGLSDSAMDWISDGRYSGATQEDPVYSTSYWPKCRHHGRPGAQDW
jgi:Ca2+-binding RTX toxin-like protein